MRTCLLHASHVVVTLSCHVSRSKRRDECGREDDEKQQLIYDQIENGGTIQSGTRLDRGWSIQIHHITQHAWDDMHVNQHSRPYSVCSGPRRTVSSCSCSAAAAVSSPASVVRTLHIRVSHVAATSAYNTSMIRSNAPSPMARSIVRSGSLNCEAIGSSKALPSGGEHTEHGQTW